MLTAGEIDALPREARDKVLLSHPEIMRRYKIWIGLKEGEFVLRKDGVVVCRFCGGNCGQCGHTGTLGNVPASMQVMVNNLLGLERKPWWRRLLKL